MPRKKIRAKWKIKKIKFMQKESAIVTFILYIKTVLKEIG